MKKVAIMIADGSEDIEAIAPVDILRRAEIPVDLIGISSSKEVSTQSGITIKVDKTLKDICNLQNYDEFVQNYDMIVLPGGMTGANNFANSENLINILKIFNEKNKYIASICASPAIVLTKAEIVNNKKITSYPGNEFKNMLENAGAIYKEDIIVIDGNLITSRGPATAIPFAYKLVEILKNENLSKEVASGMLWDLVKSH